MDKFRELIGLNCNKERKQVVLAWETNGIYMRRLIKTTSLLLDAITFGNYDS